MRWPKGPPHLALSPPYLFVFVCFVCLVCFFVFVFWRVEGAGEVVQRATSLGPKPSNYFSVFFVFSVVFFCFPCLCFK